jgi:hypothetical protein
LHAWSAVSARRVGHKDGSLADSAKETKYVIAFTTDGKNKMGFDRDGLELGHKKNRNL